jgi:hypothetical protein
VIISHEVITPWIYLFNSLVGITYSETLEYIQYPTFGFLWSHTSGVSMLRSPQLKPFEVGWFTPSGKTNRQLERELSLSVTASALFRSPIRPRRTWMQHVFGFEKSIDQPDLLQSWHWWTSIEDQPMQLFTGKFSFPFTSQLINCSWHLMFSRSSDF